MRTQSNRGLNVANVRAVIRVDNVESRPHISASGIRPSSRWGSGSCATAEPIINLRTSQHDQLLLCEMLPRM